MDSSIHDWLECRGDELVLLTMIDDATRWFMSRQDKGRALPDGVTQFGRALRDLDIDLIRAPNRNLRPADILNAVK
jgi:hypothetical protein